jgi:hypothetical protein
MNITPRKKTNVADALQQTAEWDRGATPAVWAELDRYRKGLEAIREAYALVSKLRDGSGSDLQFGTDSGRVAGLGFAIHALTGDAPQ